MTDEDFFMLEQSIKNAIEGFVGACRELEIDPKDRLEDIIHDAIND